MTTYETNDNSPSTDLSRQQMSIVTQLFRVAPTVHHVDELFQWLAYAIVQRFDIQLIQFWTNAANRTGQLAVQLRTMVRQDPSVPEQVVVSDQIALIAQRIASERRSFQPQPVATMFSQHQTTLLRRHGLNYCVGCFINANVLLPPQSNAFAQERPATLFAMTTLLFLRQSPHLDLVPTVGNILEQALALAGNRGLLLSVATSARSSFATQTPQQDVLPPLTELIPRRKQDASFLLTSNPFASAAVISDKQARRLHAAIDGRTNVAALCRTTGMDMQTIYAALQILLDQHRIEVYEPNGQLVDASLFLKNR